MNRYLLAGASALALTVGASAANAQFTVTLGGDLTVDFGYTSLDSAKDAAGRNIVEDSRNTDFTQRARITFTATQKTDSGLTYGVQNRMRYGGTRAGGAAGTSADVDFDRSFIFVNGGFGQIVLGQNFGFFENSNARADAWGTGGADGIFPNFVGGQQRGTGANAMFMSGNTSFATLPVSDGSSSRIYYVTPDFSGFKASVGYAPTIGAGDKGRAAQLDQNAATFNDVIEVGVNYGAALSGVRVDLNLGYVFGSGRPGATTAANAAGLVGATEDLSAYAASLRLGFGAAQVSVHYVNAGQSGQTKVDTRKEDAYSYMVYGQYTVLPELTIGANWGKYTGPGSTTIRGDHETTAWGLGAAYTVAPGLTLRPEYVNYNFDNNEAGGRDYSGNVFVLRTQVSF